MMVMAVPSGAFAQDEGGEKKPSMHEMARISSLPKAHADFSRFLYRPAGDKVIEQPDANRLLFRNKQGEPDGYAERRGNAIVYFDRHGKVTQVQPFNDDDPPSE
ncbi:hypothetical protein [Neoasaia chiangmaiensis]|uniref:hypothetical protein n=1 Tax=Neoasaia chiangmaiensis TaxID=320497 RepID=UPI00098ACC01|nr:hypothetical protein [Neoasaia chiangmaiensis]